VIPDFVQQFLRHKYVVHKVKRSHI